jgi:hypothetical protein
MSHLPALVRHSSPRRRDRHPYRPGTAGTPRHSHHPNLYPRARHQPGRRPQPRRLAFDSDANRCIEPILPLNPSVSPILPHPTQPPSSCSACHSLLGLHSVPLGDTVHNANGLAIPSDTPPTKRNLTNRTSRQQAFFPGFQYRPGLRLVSCRPINTASLLRERRRERYHSNRVVADSFFAVTSVLSMMHGRSR